MIPVAPTRTATAGWVIYDLANTIFALGVVGLYLPNWMTDNGVSDSWLGYTQSLAALVVALSSAWIGARSDHSHRRMPILVFTTTVAVAATLTLTLGPVWTTFLALGIALVCFHAGSVVYDALLPTVSTEENRSLVSGTGVGVGYIGSIIGVGIGWLAMNPLKLGYHGTFVLLGLAVLLFAIPTFLWVRDPIVPPRPEKAPGLSSVLSGLVKAWKDSRLYPGVTRFLLGRFLYTDAINTLIGGFLTIYAIEEIGLDTKGSQGLIASAIGWAILGGFSGGRLGHHIGAIRTLRVALVFWMLAIGLALASSGFQRPGLVPIVALLGGWALGATWATDRVVMTRISPPERLGEFYGLYATVGRFAQIIGPAVWAITVDQLQLGRDVAVALLGALVVGGWFVIRKADDSPNQVCS